MEEASERRGGFLFNVNLVFLSQIAIYGSAFGLRVVLARGLGDSGLGTYSLFFVGILVAGGVANLGVGLGNIYFLNKAAHEYRVLLSNSLAVILWSTIASWVIVLLWAAAYGRDLLISGDAYWLWGVALPAVIAYTILTSFLHGQSRFVALQTLAIGQALTAFLAVGVLEAVDHLNVGTAVAAWTGSFVAADLVCLLLIGVGKIDLRTVLFPRMDALRDQVKYGVQGQLANMAALFNYRVDQFLVAAFVSRAAVGHYTVAVGLSESVWWISSAVSLVMLPRLTAMTEEAAQEVTPLVCRNTFLISILAGLGLIAVAPIAIKVLFGDEFYPDSFLPLVLLMPGIVAASASRVLGSYLFSQGRVIYNTYASLIALGLSTGLDFVAVPLFHVNGAAAMSSIAYVCALIATLYWYGKVSGQPVREALIPHLDDRRHYLRILRRVMDRSGKDSDNRPKWSIRTKGTIEMVKEKRVSMTEAKQHLGELVKRVVYGGETIVLEFRGKPQAVIERYGRRRHLSVEEDLALLDRMRALRREIAEQFPEQEDSAEIIRRMRDERDQQLLGLR